MENHAQATIADRGEKRGPRVVEHPQTANPTNFYGVDKAMYILRHPLARRFPTGDTLIGYRAGWPPSSSD